MRGLAVVVAALAGANVALAGKAHEHGVVKADVALEGGTLTIQVVMPQESLLGFERPPRSATERMAATAVLAKVRDGAALFKPDAAAQCTLQRVQVEAPALEGAAAASAAKEEHADVDASYVFNCAQPALLKSMDVALFDAFRRVQRIDVQAALPGGQRKTVLRRPAQKVPLTR